MSASNHSEDQSLNVNEKSSPVRETAKAPEHGNSEQDPSELDPSHQGPSEQGPSEQDPSKPGMVTSPTPRSTGPSIKMIAIGVAVVLTAFIGVLATRKTQSNDRASRVLGQAAPQITGISLLDGKPFDLQAQQGKFVVVNYFATWCPPCVIEHPELVKFSEAHPEVGMVSVVFQDNVDGVRKFFAKRGGTWPVIDSERAAVDFGVRGVPETYLISPAGQLIFQTNGGVTQKALEKAINRASTAAAVATTVPAQ